MNNMSQTTLFSRIALLVVSVTLLLTACGQQDTVAPAATSGGSVNTGTVATPQVTPVAIKPGTTNSTSSQLDACALVTQKEADEAIGDPSTLEKHAAPLAGFTECDYSVNKGEKHIRIELISKGGGAYYSKAKAESSDYAPVDVAGLGDLAFKYSENEGSDVILAVLKGNSVCRIKVSNLTDNDKQVTDLMQKAIGHLAGTGAVQLTFQTAALLI
jgi:hypothetical protein